MATANITADPTPASASTSAALLISLPSLARDSFDRILENLASAFASESLVVATPDGNVPGTVPGGLQVVGYTPAAPSPGAWTLVAADFLNAHELARQHDARAVLLLGPEAHSLSPSALRSLAHAALEGADLAVPRYALPARAGLVNSAILYPISRALFGAAPRFPLALDLGLSARMAERMAAAAQRFTAANQSDALLWPVAEAAIAGFTIAQVDAGERAIPQPPDSPAAPISTPSSPR